jgi:DNA polymerase III delta subunit
MMSKNMTKKTKTATKAKAKINFWDRTFLFCGEPCTTRLAMNGLVVEHELTSIKTFNSGDKGTTVASALTAFNWDMEPFGVFVTNPTADIFKAVQETLENRKPTATVLAFAVEGDYFDSRLSFVSQASKQKRLMEFDYIDSSNKSALIEHFKDWETGTGINLQKTILQWLVNNAPIRICKVKGKNGKRDTEVYDLLALEMELEKLLPLLESGEISVKELPDMVDFQQENDIWGFVRTCLAGDLQKSMKYMEKLSESQSLNSTLWLMFSQIGLLISIKAAVQDGNRTAEDVCKAIDVSNYAGKFYLPDWTMSQVSVAVPNHWRVQKAMESCSTWSMDRIIAQLHTTSSAIIDLRNGIPEEVLAPMYLMAMSGQATYRNPLTKP